MALQQLLIFTAVSMLVVLAVTRLVRVQLGRSPHPAGKARLPFTLAFLFLPPIVVEAAVLRPMTSAAWLHAIESVLVYLGTLVVVSILMGIAALIASRVATGRPRRVLLLALVGSEPDPDDVPFDPALTPELAESVAAVDVRNAAFPRGPEFQMQIERAGFRNAWDALDKATSSLEARIAHDRALRLAVASEATITAEDARSRLDALRHLAIAHGQAWAT